MQGNKKNIFVWSSDQPVLTPGGVIFVFRQALLSFDISKHANIPGSKARGCLLRVAGLLPEVKAVSHPERCLHAGIILELLYIFGRVVIRGRMNNSHKFEYFRTEPTQMDWFGEFYVDHSSGSASLVILNVLGDLTQFTRFVLWVSTKDLSG